MTIWTPQIANPKKPLYLSIADAIEEDIERGILVEGAKLPPQRDLAWEIKVTLGTVSRAYKEAIRRKIVHGETGRGTFVRTTERALPPLAIRPTSSHLDLGRNLVFPWLNPDPMAMFQEHQRHHNEFNIYTPSEGLLRHREAGAVLLETHFDTPADPADVAVTIGGQHGLQIALQAVLNPGDKLGVEELTYPNILGLCEQLGIKAIPIPLCRDEGSVNRSTIDVDAFEELTRIHSLKAMVLIPGLQNPTGRSMGQQDRERVAQIALRTKMALITDDAYCALLQNRPQSFSTLAPELTLTVATPAKLSGPGLRIAYLHTPSSLRDAVQIAIGNSVWMAPPLCAEIQTRWIMDGVIDQIIAAKRSMCAHRYEIARSILGNIPMIARTDCPFVWLPRSEQMDSDYLVSILHHNGVDVLSSTVFQDQAPGAQLPVASSNGLRVALGTIESEGDFTKAIGLVAQAVQGTLRRQTTRVVG